MNRFTIAIFCACLLAFASAEGTCRIFSCGDIKQPEEGPQVCVQQQTENAVDQFHVAGCGDQFCQAFQWASPDAATEAGVCGTEFPIPNWGVFSPADNAGLDGDYCEEDAHCYSSEKNAATCKSKVCTATTKAESECDNANDCPIGHTCTDNACAALVAENGQCATAIDCDFGLDCVTLDGAENPTCVRRSTLANGAKFVRPTTLAGETNVAPVGSSVCKSRFEVVIDGTSQCRQGTTNADQSSLTRDNAGDSCATHVFDNDDLEKFEEFSEASTEAKCGFNKDSNAHCVPQPGDDNIVSEIQRAFDQTKGHKCHQLSGAEAGSVCAATLNWQRSDDGWRFHNKATNVGDAMAQQHANVANNDKCVAETLTISFWQGHYDDNAFGFSFVAVSAVASILSFVF